MIQKVVSIISTKARFNKTKIINRKCFLQKSCNVWNNDSKTHHVKGQRAPMATTSPGTGDN